MKTDQKYGRAMKLALDLQLEEPIDVEAATARHPRAPADALDRVLAILLPMLEELKEPLAEGQECPLCGGTPS